MTRADPCRGFAAKSLASGQIIIETIGPTQRFVQVNWLVTHAHIVITNATADETIERLWKRLSVGVAVCVPVTITESSS